MSGTSSRADLLVVGGGPAGLATSIFAAQRGMKVVLLERGVLPRDKPCGEGLMPEGVRLLGAMGVSVMRSHPIHGIRYLDETNCVADARFTSAMGLGIRRVELSRAMLQRARSLGVRVQERSRVSSIRNERAGVVAEAGHASFEAPLLVAADGLHSPLRRASGLEISGLGRARRARYGFRRHYRIAPWTSYVEVYWARGAEAYVTPVGPDEVGVALLWHEPASSFEAMLRRFPALDARLRGAPVTTATKGSGPLRRGARRVHAGRLVLVGDAAGYLDAITGEGVALGFQSARALVVAITSGQGFAGYESAYRRLRRRHVVMTEAALLLAQHPWLRRRVIRALSRHPSVFRRLLLALAPSSKHVEPPRLKLDAPAGTLDLS